MSKPKPPTRPSTGQRRPIGQRPTVPPGPPQKPPPPNPTAGPPPPLPAKPSTARAHPTESLEVLSTMPSTVASPNNQRLLSVKMRHLIRVYVIHLMLSVLAVAQLLSLRIYNLNFAVLIDPTVPGLVWLLLALGCLLVLAFVYLAHQCPCNYLLAIVIVELIVLFVNSHQWPLVSLPWIGGVLAIVLILNLLLYVMGIYLPLIVLPGIIFMIVVTLVCVVIVVSIYVIVYLNGNRYMLRYVSMVSLFYVASIVLFTITVVHQRRFDYLAHTDYVLQASVLAMLFVYLIHVLSTVVRFGQFLVDHV
ncbi:uncharacterized protein LOC128263892 [Drosophila gunungcola]|uniref:uncharacterized protein LOC128263892 n=1 Tax=Drosophila gunungcola TaxID=103775 RepID=UPI0022E03A50|nr:uncharacterized protein LOC128263892 [Drosophila gunungcola]